MTSVTEALNFKFDVILMNLSSYGWLVAPTLDGAALTHESDRAVSLPPCPPTAQGRKLKLHCATHMTLPMYPDSRRPACPLLSVNHPTKLSGVSGVSLLFCTLFGLTVFFCLETLP